MYLRPFNIFILYIGLLIFSSCKTKPADILIRKWKVSELTGFPAENLMNSTFEFDKDGTYKSQVDGNDKNGTYVISEDGKTITITNFTGDFGLVNIIELTKNKFVGKMGDKTIICVPF